jgi:hypothetical protein
MARVRASRVGRRVPPAGGALPVGKLFRRGRVPEHHEGIDTRAVNVTSPGQ